MEPRFKEPLCNEDILHPSNISKMWGKEPWYNETTSERTYYASPLALRLWVVPLSLSLSCVTRNKTTKKRPCENLGARSTRKEGLPPKPKSLPFHSRMIFWCEISSLINSIHLILTSCHCRLSMSSKIIAQNMPWRMPSSSDRKTPKKAVKGRPTEERSCNDFCCVWRGNFKIFTVIL